LRKRRVLLICFLSVLEHEALGSLILVGIPAYNEEKSIAKVLVLTRQFADKIVVCDDGSKDLTGKIAENLGAEIMVHKRNLGYGAALSELFDKAMETGADVLVTLDADGQHDPAFIPQLVSAIENGADVAIGSRLIGSASFSGSGRRKLGVRMISKATDISTDQGIRDSQSGFRAYGKRAIAELRPTEMGMGASVEILVKSAQIGLHVTEVPIDVSYDNPRGSRTNSLMHGADVLASLIKHTSMRRPLLFYGGVGVCMIIVGFLFGLWTLLLYAQEGRVVTNVAMLSLMMTLLGTFSLFTGIILFTVISAIRER
jgi:glycosyltransferase involved in cell wall biosynthesis